MIHHPLFLLAREFTKFTTAQCFCVVLTKLILAISYVLVFLLFRSDFKKMI